MIRKFKRHQNNRKFYRVNERIFASTLRLLDAGGKQIGVFPRYQALDLARKKSLDLVEVAPMATPPVAKLIDFKKFIYQEAKKLREEKKKTKVSETKELRLGPFMNEHDLNVMIRRGRVFLEDNNKVRMVLKFIGRQITHPEFGKDIVQKVILALSDVSKIEREPHLEGKQLIAILSPERKRSSASKKANAKEENKEISIKKV